VEPIDDVAKLAKALGHPIRVCILDMLLAKRRFCGDLVALLGLAQSTVSHHLKILRESGLVLAQEQGTWVCYEVNRQRLYDLRNHLDRWLAGEKMCGGFPPEIGRPRSNALQRDGAKGGKP
jgi:Predicted transcriptional regulators